MASRKSAEAIERQLKELLRQGQNRFCVNCDAMGPQYVITSGFNVFVCTTCSGVHRQFGHRVKGVSMSTFQADEVAALKEGGNERFMARFCCTWTPGALPKPVDRTPEAVREWIDAVYVTKRFFADSGVAPAAAAGAAGPEALAAAGPSAGQAQADSGGEIPAVQPLSALLGSDTPKLKIGPAEAPAERTSEGAGSSGAAEARQAPNLLDMGSLSPQRSPGRSAAAADAPWDAFGTGAAPAPSSASPQSRPAPPPPAPAVEGWAAFGDMTLDGPAGPAVAEPNGLSAKPVSPGRAATSAPAPQNGTHWEMFGGSPAPPPAPAANGVPLQAAPSGDYAGQPAGAPAARQEAPKPQARPEIQLDVFYPEFEAIRATGMLPTGQPAPGFHHHHHHHPQAPGLVRPEQQQPAGYYPPQQQQYAARPTVAIPPEAGAANYYNLHSAPGAVGLVSPGVLPSPSAFSPGSFPSSASSSFSVGGMPSAQGSAALQPYGSSSMQPYGSSLQAGSYSGSGAFGASASPHPAPKLGDPAADPFSGLGPSFRGAPAAAASAAPPAPASAVYAAPASAAGTTLFGSQPSLAAMPYDLTAPAAPKPKASGNPFA